MKVIMIAISKGLIARNLLQNEFYALVKRHFDCVVLLSPAAQDRRFVEEFKADNVSIIPLPETHDTFLSRLLANLSRYIIYNGRTEMMGAYNFDRAQNVSFFWWYPKYLFLKLIFKPLSKVAFLRKALQKISGLFLHQKTVAEYQALIRQYGANVVFAPNIGDDTEAAFIEAAHRERVPSVAMVKSWDNFSKRYFGARADTFAVWNQFMLTQAQTLQDYKPAAVKIVGVPQFDYYIDRSRLWSREEFCQRVGLDPNKKIIFFGSEGKLMPTDSNIVGVIRDFIVRGELAHDCQVFVRPHFAYTNDRDKFKDFFPMPEVVVDRSHHFSSRFSDNWDYSRQQMDHFLNAIYHSAVVINTASTLTADAIALNRPVILIKFEGYEKKSKYESVVGWYTSDYYREVTLFQVALEADSVESLRAAINGCLTNPNIKQTEREKFKEYFCLAVDGQAGKRLFDVVSGSTKD